MTTVGPTIGATWRRIQKQLEDAGLDPAPGEGRAIVAAVMGLTRDDFIGRENEIITVLKQKFIDQFSSERLTGRPLAHILGAADFAGRVWRVTADVLIPRPDTETLLQVALNLAPSGAKLAEIGLGSGALLASLLLERRDIVGFGTELSPAALAVARTNLTEAGVLQRATLCEGDLLAPLPADLRLDLIVSNPPYIAEAEWAALEPGVRDFEPRLALVGGADGLDIYRRLIPQAFGRLAPGGVLAVEIGHTQGQAVAALFEATGFKNTEVTPDLAGRDRVVAGLL